MLTSKLVASLIILIITIHIGGSRDIFSVRSSGGEAEGGLGLMRSRRSLDQFRVRLCGNQLVTMLIIVCRDYSLSHRGNEKYRGDRSASNSVRAKRGISSSTRRHRVRGSPRVAGGLADTCCQGSCSLDQLRAAC